MARRFCGLRSFTADTCKHWLGNRAEQSAKCKDQVRIAAHKISMVTLQRSLPGQTWRLEEELSGPNCLPIRGPVKFESEGWAPLLGLFGVLIHIFQHKVTLFLATPVITWCQKVEAVWEEGEKEVPFNGFMLVPTLDLTTSQQWDPLQDSGFLVKSWSVDTQK